MRPHDSPGDADEWLEFAEGDLRAASHADWSELRIEIVCFHAQQAAEKALKAVIVARGHTPAYTHNIQRLMDTLDDLGVSTPAALREADTLTVFAVATRYPGAPIKPNALDHMEALTLARNVVSWARGVLQSLGSDSPGNQG